ncbi:hypothetical protein ABW04_22170 [Priestia megaterium]|jgi:hypothetical protein|nr:hypothetical protein ABW04_22170 [Priestia megaterium]
MYPTLEDENRTWAGRFDLIMVTMKNVKVQVCLSIYIELKDEAPTKKALEIDFKDLIYRVRNTILR